MPLTEIFGDLGFAQIVLLGLSLFLAFAFEVVNGFHDTANAVATVIYTRTLRPTPAVIWSGLCNMLGILLGGISVAYSIVYLLPTEVLESIHSGTGGAVVVSILGAAILWNLATWYVGLPASSSHALIGSLLGVAIAYTLMKGGSAAESVNFGKLKEIGLALLLSPILGFVLSALLMKLLQLCHAGPKILAEPEPGTAPPFWIRATLLGTCTGVSFCHGSNDGQKGMGLIMLILIGMAPSQYALNLEQDGRCDRVRQAAADLEVFIDENFAKRSSQLSLRTISYQPISFFTEESSSARRALRRLREALQGKHSFSEIASERRMALRSAIHETNRLLDKFKLRAERELSSEKRAVFLSLRQEIKSAVEYVPRWVIVAVALCLGFGTMVGWQRIVVTVGEKIGKSHLTYGQGASAELVAMSTIALADAAGLPVSTTQVLSSGVAGTMWANRSGINRRTLSNLLLAWGLTLPAVMLLSSGLFVLLHLVLS